VRIYLFLRIALTVSKTTATSSMSWIRWCRGGLNPESKKQVNPPDIRLPIGALLPASLLIPVVQHRRKRLERVSETGPIYTSVSNGSPLLTALGMALLQRDESLRSLRPRSTIKEGPFMVMLSEAFRISTATFCQAVCRDS
jgi:hypothetical protein